MTEPLQASAEHPGAHPAPKPANEAERLQALRDLELLDTLPETAFDDIVQIASAVCGVPIALVSLVDSDRQWFKARVGLGASETHRDLAFCAHAINTPDQVFEVPDASLDVRFASNPLVTQDPSIRFYAGTPLLTPEGHAIGTLCVIDRVPHTLTAAQSEALVALGRRVMSETQLRSNVRRLEATRKELEQTRVIADQRAVLLESILESIPSAVIAVDANQDLLVYNSAAAAITGFAAKEVPKDRRQWPKLLGIHDAASGRILDSAELTMDRVMRGETSVLTDLMFHSQHQPVPRYARARASAITMATADGSARGAVLVMNDVTERRRAEAALENSELRYRTLVANMPVMVYRAAPVAPWKVQYASEACEQITGYPASHFVEGGVTWADIMFEEDVAAVSAMVGHETGTGRNGIRVDYRIRHRDGSIRWVEDHDRLTADGSSLEGVMFDITDRKTAEIAKVESETRFRLITDVSPNIVWTAAPDGGIDFVNQAGLGYFGRTLQQLTGKGWLEQLHPDDLDETMAQWTHSLHTGDPVEVQYRIRRHDGAFRWHITRGVASFDAKGRPDRWYGVITDIEEVKQAQQVAEHARIALEASESRYRFLSEAIPIQVWTADADGRIEYVNESASRYFGRSTQQILDEGWIDLIHADDREQTMHAWTQAVASAGEERYDTEFRLRRSDGEYRWMLGRATALKKADGRVEKWFGTSIEIEEIKRAQAAAEQSNAALTQSEAHYRFLSEAIPLQVWTARPDGRLDYLNGFTAEYMGLSTERLLNESWDGLLHPDDVERTYKRWMHSVNTAEPYDIEYRMLRHDGKFCWNLTRGLAFKNAAGKVEKWFGSTIEIEEIKNAQRLAEDATRAKSAFLSSMSHEIRTPMNAVIGMTSILLDSGLNAEQRESAEVIRTSGDHLLTVINDILDYSKIEAGKLDLERNAFSVRECIEGALDLVAASASAQGVEIGYLMEAGMSESVLGDVGRLRQVLLNLLSNGVKFTPAGGEVMVEAREKRLDSGRHRIEFSISDSGLGIDPEKAPLLFQPFVQADSSTTRKFGGTGLGLSISRRLVEAMGGSIAVDSTPGHGSVFHFHIEVEPAAATGRHSPPAGVPQLTGRRVLIVDDIEINRRILIHYVRSWGMVPHTTGLPREALEWLSRGDVFDLALFDFHMPEIDGLTLSRRAREHAPGLPIVILSSASLDTADAAIVSGALLKPIKPARLLEAIAGLLTPAATQTVAVAPGPELPRELGHEHPLRLLVVEDNPVNQRVARLLLERMGYSPDFAANGMEGLNSVARQIYDVVLMDVQMPVMDGLIATRELCRRYPANSRPRIVGMTANATEEDRLNCLRAGMDDYLAKPVRPAELAAALRASPRRDVGSEAEDDFSAQGLAELRRVYGDDGALEIIGALVVDLESQSAELQQSLETQDLPVMQRVAHTLKSNSRLVGAAAMGDHWDEVERMTRTATPEVTGRVALALMARYGRLVRHLHGEAGLRSQSD